MSNTDLIDYASEFQINIKINDTYVDIKAKKWDEKIFYQGKMLRKIIIDRIIHIVENDLN